MGNPTCEFHFTASKEGDDDPLPFIQSVFLFVCLYVWFCLFICFLLGTVQGSQDHNENKATWVPRLLELAMQRKTKNRCLTNLCLHGVIQGERRGGGTGKTKTKKEREKKEKG